MTSEANTEIQEEKDAVTQAAKAAIKEDLTKLTDKDIKYRAKYKETLGQVEEIKAASERQVTELNEKLIAAEKNIQMADQKRIESEVKALSISEGLTDTDLIKLMDISKVTINEAGEIQGAKEIIAAFKAAKPAFFAALKKASSSTNADVGTDATGKKANAFDIPDAEFKRSLNLVPHSF